jgi:ssDNA-binding Zn-finger/Zn-ribbon topoisomerase 1
MTRDVRAKVRAGACPTCGSALIEKKIGKMTPFWGCVRYGAETRPCSYAERGTAAAAPASDAPRAPKRTTRGAAKRAPAVPQPAALPPARPTARDATDRPCPRCAHATLDVVTPSGAAPFWACTDRACGFTLPVGARRRATACPDCGGVVLERRRADDASYWQCARHPACGYEAARSPAAT